MKKEMYSIEFRSVKGGYEASVPLLNIAVIGTTVEETLDKAISAVAVAIEARKPLTDRRKRLYEATKPNIHT